MLHSQQIQAEVRAKIKEHWNKIDKNPHYHMRENSTTAIYPDYFRIELSYYKKSGVNDIHETCVMAFREEGGEWHIMGMTRRIDKTHKTTNLQVLEDKIIEKIVDFVNDTPEFYS